MDADTIAALVGNLGFPIVVAGWLLFRTDKMMREIVSALRELTREIRDASERANRSR